MRKLALILGSLLLAANASAKEVVAAPVAVEEPVVVVEEAVVPVVPAFKPSGYVGIEQKYFAAGEHDNLGGNFFRTEFTGSIMMTEADKLMWRVRSYDDLNGTGSDITPRSENTETRYRWLHSFGTLGDSKVKIASRFEMRQRSDYDKYEGQMRFNFVDYIPDLSWFETTDFTLAPKIRYISYGESDDEAVGAGMDFSHYAVLPWGFESDLTVYYVYNDNYQDGYRNSSQYPGSKKDLATRDSSNSNNIDVEYYIYYNHMMWESQDKFYGFNAYAETGLDSLTYRDGAGDTNNNSMYIMPEGQFLVRVNPATEITLAAGAEYRNFGNDEMSSIKNFTWDPFIRAAIKTVF